MSKGLLRGISIGIIFSTIVLSYFLYPFEERVGNELAGELTLNNEMVDSYLKETGQKSVSLEEYEQLIAQSEELENVKHDLQKMKQELEDKGKEQDRSDEKQIPQEETITYTLEIRKGMSSAAVSKRLEDVRIINNAAQFVEYLKKKDWQTSIQIGTFQVTNKMTTDEIARLITHH